MSFPIEDEEITTTANNVNKDIFDLHLQYVYCPSGHKLYKMHCLELLAMEI